MKNSMTTTANKFITSKYLVNLNILQVDKRGKRKSENLQYVFDEGELLQKRRNAIEKAQKIMNSFNNDESFSSPAQAHKKEFKNFKAYSIDIFLIIEDEGEEYDYHIYGDEEIVYETLEAEANFFKNEFEIAKFVKISNDMFGEIEVIEEKLDFFLIKYKSKKCF
jgi:transcriptional regulator of heat shock response